SAFATIDDFGAQSSRPASSLCTLRTRQSPSGMATLATGPPATALTGLALHQLDLIKGFHCLINSTLRSEAALIKCMVPDLRRVVRNRRVRQREGILPCFRARTLTGRHVFGGAQTPTWISHSLH